MEATTLLCNDHRKVEQLFRDYQAATTPEMKKMCVDKIATELSIHAEIEELKFYPMAAERVPEAVELVEESLAEHQKVKDTLAELERMDPEDGEYDIRVEALVADVKHHVQEEEHQLFPTVRAACSVQDLQHLGQDMEEAKAAASAQPHDTAHANQVIREQVRGPSEVSRPSSMA